MSNIPNIDKLIREVSCPNIDSYERYDSKYTKPGITWCDSDSSKTCEDPNYMLAGVKKIQEEAEGCGCRPGGLLCGQTCAFGLCTPLGGKYRSSWGAEKCLAKENVYPRDEKSKIDCCSGASKAVDCHPNFCAGNAQCREFMKNYCLGGENKYFDRKCQKWVENNYANREDILTWAVNICDNMLNKNKNLTTTNDEELIEWCKINSKANPGHFDQVFDKYCLNKEQQYETSICSCYGNTKIPGATQSVPNECLGDCGQYGYKSNKMLKSNCTIAMCNTEINLNDIKDSQIALGTLKNACSAQVGDAIIQNESDYGENNMNPLIEKSMLPEQLVNIGKQLGLDEIAKKMNIKFDVLVIIIIVAGVLLLLNLNQEEDKTNIPFNYYYR